MHKLLLKTLTGILFCLQGFSSDCKIEYKDMKILTDTCFAKKAKIRHYEEVSNKISLSKFHPKTKDTVLMTAVKHSETDVVEWLLERDVELQSKNKKGETALMYFAKHIVDIELFQNFLDKLGEFAISEMKKKDRIGRTPLLFALYSNQSKEVIEKMIEYGASAKDKDSFRRNTLMYAARYTDDPEVMAVLAEHGASINATDKSGQTALFYVSRFSKDMSKYQFLEDKGAKTSLKDKKGLTAKDYL